MLSNKKNIIIAGVVIIILIMALILAVANRRNNGAGKLGGKNNAVENLATPQFLTAAERVDLRLADNVKAQVLSRDASGTPAVYRVIKTDADIVVDPSQVGPLSPRR